MSETEDICAGCLKDIDLKAEDTWSVEIKLVSAPHATEFPDVSAEEAGQQLREIYDELEEQSKNEAERSVARTSKHYLCNGCANKFDDDPFKGLNPPKSS